MFSKILTRATLIALCSVPAVAMAQETLKIGFVNFQRLVQQSPQAIAATEQLRDEFSPRERELIAMQTALEEKAAELEKNMEVMGPTERENAQRTFRDEQRAFVRAQNELREDSDLRLNEVLQSVQRELAEEVQLYGQERGFDLLLIDGVLHVSDKVDATGEVLERLRAKAGGAAE